jgi:uncharacterized protein YkwD
VAAIGAGGFLVRAQEPQLNRITHLSVLSLTLALAACGGGRGDIPKPAPAPAATSPVSPVPAPAPAQPSAPAPSATLSAATSCALPNFQQEIVNRINAARANSRMCGSTFYNAAGPLTWNDKLFAAGVGHATDMGNNNYFSHTSQDGRTFDQRITAAGYSWSTVGENIAAGQTGIEQVMNEWLNSPGHCANIMSGNYTEVGVTCVKNDSSAYKQYWAMELGHPR